MKQMFLFFPNFKARNCIYRTGFALSPNITSSVEDGDILNGRNLYFLCLLIPDLIALTNSWRDAPCKSWSIFFFRISPQEKGTSKRHSGRHGERKPTLLL
jgi:hypothetical protein